MDHAKNSLVQILAGKIFIGARLKAAGHVASNVCYHCSVREDHDHIFRACPQYEQSRPSLATMPHDLCWRTGIMFSPTLQFEFLDLWQILFFDSSDPVGPEGVVFIEGSCFIHHWSRVRAASSAVYFPNQIKWVMSLPGSCLTSQRAEIWALAMAGAHRWTHLGGS